MDTTIAEENTLREQFIAARGLVPDPFQLESFDAVDSGGCVVVSAPTGSGKTLIAEYAVARAISANGHAFYTTPLKALSNQQYLQLCQTYGVEQVGLLTGDRSINPDARIIVMTTEVLRNMIYESEEDLPKSGCVILDEVHFLQDRERGSVWEEVIVLTPPSLQLICLSATISNAQDLAAWIKSVRGSAAVITETNRPVQLQHYCLSRERRTGKMILTPTLVNGKPNPEGFYLDSTAARRGARRLTVPKKMEVLDFLASNAMLPAIVFIFSRSGCDRAVRICLEEGIRLTNDLERARIEEIVESKVESLSDDDLSALGYGEFITALSAGVASHHAGMVRAFREAVETCFNEGLIKVTFATETLALGIDMPARTVVIEKLSKYDGKNHTPLSAGEYAQLVGRAGRRGKDAIGNAVVLWNPYVSFRRITSLAASPPPDVLSSFRPTYNTAANMVKRYTPEEAAAILERSFAQWQANAGVLEISRDALSSHMSAAITLLESLGYVTMESGWSLSEKGDRLARIYHEMGLVVAEAMHQGVFDDLRPEELGALVSAFCYEPRGHRGQSKPSIPSRILTDRFELLVDIANKIIFKERELGLDQARLPQAGLMTAALSWAKGRPLKKALFAIESAPGDFVRYVKQTVDLLRQIADVAPTELLCKSAAEAAAAMDRGVVASYSDVVDADLETMDGQFQPVNFINSVLK